MPGLGFKPRDASRRSSSILPTERLFLIQGLFVYFFSSRLSRCRLSHSAFVVLLCASFSGSVGSNEKRGGCCCCSFLLVPVGSFSIQYTRDFSLFIYFPLSRFLLTTSILRALELRPTDIPAIQRRLETKWQRRNASYQQEACPVARCRLPGFFRHLHRFFLSLFRSSDSP